MVILNICLASKNNLEPDRRRTILSYEEQLTWGKVDTEETSKVILVVMGCMTTSRINR